MIVLSNILIRYMEFCDKMDILEGYHVLEEILGNRTFIVKNYIEDTITLVKSMILINPSEAKTYNDYVEQNYPAFPINRSDKTKWRYYRHIAGLKHEVDVPIYITSIDNLQQIELTRDNLNLYLNTKQELLKFDKYYKEVIDTYPEYELYIKAIITDKLYNIQELVKLDLLTIVTYNKNYIEDNEQDIITELQVRLNNYKVTWNVTAYSMSDTLFIAAQTAILYNYIVQTIIALRLKNAKTIKAHSHHIKNYFSSHHYLDVYYDYLTKKQAVFLYLNLLYLDNHSGNNFVFETLIKKLFTDRNISIAAYRYLALNSIDSNKDVEYKFKKEFFDDLNVDYYNYSLEDIVTKETSILPGNGKFHDLYKVETDKQFKRTLDSSYNTKDLEVVVYDYTDNVKHKILDEIMDYLAYTCKLGITDFQVSVNNPSNTKTFSFSIADAFKLMIFMLYRYNDNSMYTLPDYTIKRVRKLVLPSTDTLLQACYKTKLYYKDEINKIKDSTISYPSMILSNNQFHDFIEKIYKNDMALWLYLANLDEIDTEGQFYKMTEMLYTTDTYSLDNEHISDFTSRLSLEEILNYDKNETLIMFTSLINNIYGNKYSSMFNLKYIQKAMIEIFKKFKSYSTQIVSEFYVNDIVLCGIKPCRYNIATDSINKLYYHNSYKLNVDTKTFINNKHEVYLDTEYKESYRYSLTLEIRDNVFYKCELSPNASLIVPLVKTMVVTDNDKYVVTESTQDDLLFLATTPIN